MTQFESNVWRRFCTSDYVKCETISCQHRWVSEAVPLHYNKVSLLLGNQQYHIIINAPTGSGKNTFIFEKVIKEALALNRTVLVLTNRKALNIQQTKIFLEQQNLPDKPLESLDEPVRYKNCVITTYQSVLSSFNRICYELSYVQPLYIVFDETHFFCADALFNPKTYKILSQIIFSFPNSQRIYMSATPEIVTPMIKAIESELFSSLPNSSNYPADIPRIREYHLTANHQNITPHSFVNWSDLVDQIYLDKETEQKWLIFVSNKDTGTKLKSDLKKLDISCTYVDADSLSGSPILSTLVIHEKFADKVLIATSVFDNGINVRDDLVKNIVIDFTDRVQFLQMLGRKRRAENEKINLYFRVPDVKEISGRKHSLIQQKKFFDSWDFNPQEYFSQHWGDLTTMEQQLIDISFVPLSVPSQPVPNAVPQTITYYTPVFSTNLFAKAQIEYLLSWYEELESTYLLYSDAYIKIIYQWLGLEYSLQDIETNRLSSVHKIDQCKKEIQKYLDNIISGNGDPLSTDQCIKINTDLILIAVKYGFTQQEIGARKDEPQKRSLPSIKKMIAYFKLPYEIEKNGNHFTFQKTEL